MATTSLAESVRVSVSAEIATFERPDGAVVQVLSEVLNRSTLLQQAISDSAERSTVCLSLPPGVLEAWVQALKLVDVDAAQPAAPRRCADAPGLLESLQVRVITSLVSLRAKFGNSIRFRKSELSRL